MSEASHHSFHGRKSLHHALTDKAPSQTQTVVTLATAFSILHLRNLHSVYLGAGATLAALTGVYARTSRVALIPSSSDAPVSATKPQPKS